MRSLSREQFVGIAVRARGKPENAGKTLAIPVSAVLLGDQLTPVLVYRRLVAGDERTAPSFLLESVEGGERVGRHSMMGAQPLIQVVGRGSEVRVGDRRRNGGNMGEARAGDPLLVLREIGNEFVLLRGEAEEAGEALPSCALGGWFGYAGYDTVRLTEPEKLDVANAPVDDRGLADLRFGLYTGVVAFDHVGQTVHVVELGLVEEGEDAGKAYDEVIARIERRIEQIQTHSKPLPAGRLDIGSGGARAEAMPSNMTREAHAEMVARAQEYILAGDIFQVVVGQRFERRSKADPFDVYRALRAVNPSPYMVYLQSGGDGVDGVDEGCVLVASSPEILCRVRRDKGGKLVVTNRPLAGTRRRGANAAEDAALEAELLSDPKERAEHIMLVDLGRNDVGRVAEAGSIELSEVMTVERYSHVMHISSEVTGTLRSGLDAWDALGAALPVGTISGAPKVRAMQIIDELEPVRRGPYGGGLGYAGLDGEMDIALALRTMVVPVGMRETDAEGNESWMYHIQAAGGIVADSDASAEFDETVNKAAALGRAIDVAERAFLYGA